MALQVEWYAANPGFHPIPPGYGLPWGTPEEQEIPGPLVFEAELALAKEQLKTQTPPYEKLPADPPQGGRPADCRRRPAPAGARRRAGQTAGAAGVRPDRAPQRPTAATGRSARLAGRPAVCRPTGPTRAASFRRRRVPAAAAAGRATPRCCGTRGPITATTRTLPTALASYYFFRDDARFGGWQGYLQRSDDFIRFCCHMHIWEMLTARGGAGETRVVWRWPTIR